MKRFPVLTLTGANGFSYLSLIEPRRRGIPFSCCLASPQTFLSSPTHTRAHTHTQRIHRKLAPTATTCKNTPPNFGKESSRESQTTRSPELAGESRKRGSASGAEGAQWGPQPCSALGWNPAWNVAVSARVSWPRPRPLGSTPTHPQSLTAALATKEPEARDAQPKMGER
jgi:hypothetical protein